MSNAKTSSHIQCTQRLFAGEGELWCVLGQLVSCLCGEGGENKEMYLESLKRVLGTGNWKGALGHTDSAG